MWSMIYPVIIILAANTFYNISTKAMPEGINSFAALTVTYSVAAVISFIMFFVTARGTSFGSEMQKLNYAPFVLGIVIIGLELGYVLAYRNGWEMSKVSVTANILLAVVLVAVAAIFYKEQITVKKLLGIIVCAAGLTLLSI